MFPSRCRFVAKLAFNTTLMMNQLFHDVSIVFSILRYTAVVNVTEAILHHTRSILSAASQIVSVVLSAVALRFTLTRNESEGCIDRMNGTCEAEIQENKKRLQLLLNKRKRKRYGSQQVPRSSAKKKIVQGKFFCPPTMYFVLMICLQLCFGVVFASSMKETSSFSAIARTSNTDVAQNDLFMMEEESGGDVMEGMTSATNGAAAAVDSSNAGLSSRNVLVEVGGRRRRLAACPTIYTADHDNLKDTDTDGWNVWSASCAMGTTHRVESGETVKIKKSAAMVGELVIDRGSATSGNNRHFEVRGTLEMEGVTLTGAYTPVSSFCSLSSLRLFVPIV